MKKCHDRVCTAIFLAIGVAILLCGVLQIAQ